MNDKWFIIYVKPEGDVELIGPYDSEGDADADVHYMESHLGLKGKWIITSPTPLR